jgi:exonuclease V gamma subunit
VTLHLHRAPRADLLADALGSLLATPLPDAFASEVVAVPARGIERWLSQRLSHRLGAGPAGSDGVCAGVRFLSPRSLVSLLLQRERDDAWDPDRLVWPVLDVLDGCLDEPWASTLARHLGHGLEGDDADLRRARRWSVARRLAGLLAAYAVQRPGLVTDWREGRDTDGAGGPLDPDLAWQPELWRRVVARVAEQGAPPPDVRHAETSPGCARETPVSTCPTGSRCSATPGCRSPRSSCWPPSASGATSTSGCRSPRPRCGTPCATSVEWCPATPTPPPGGSTTRCWRRWGATAVS